MQADRELREAIEEAQRKMQRSFSIFSSHCNICELLYLAAFAGCATSVAACSSSPTPSESAVRAEEKVIFGSDDFREVGVLSAGDPMYRQVRATASVFSAESVLCDELAGTCNLQTQRFTYEDFAKGGWQSMTTERLPLCEGERFVGQPQGSYCTAFLVRADVAVTAGHCVRNQSDCESMKLAFGFVATDDAGLNVNTTVPMTDVYSCSEVIANVAQGSKISDEDFAVIRLDRTVTGREPFEMRTSGAIADGANVYTVSGYHGLSLKISDNAVVKNNPLSQPRFETNLDVGKGSSGSPVFNSIGQVEGILVSGPVSSNYEMALAADGTKCARAIRCDDIDGCNTPSPEEGELDWARVSRISSVVDALAGNSCFDHQLSPNETDVDCGGPKCTACMPDQLCKVDSDCRLPGGLIPACWQSPHCDAGRCALDLSTCQCRNDADCHDADASTAEHCMESNGCWRELRGDTNQDGKVDIVDALRAAQYAQGLAPQPFVPFAADVNCDGVVDQSGDAQLIAQYAAGLISQFPCAD